MAHFQLGHKAKAAEYLVKGQQDSSGSATLLEPITHLRQEAEALLGKKTEPVAKDPGKKTEPVAKGSGKNRE